MGEILKQPPVPQGENKGKGKTPSPWGKVSIDHLEKTADKLKEYAKKKEAEEVAKKKMGK